MDIRYFLLTCSMLSFLFMACTDEHQNNVPLWKEQIVDTEKAFAQMVQEKGIHAAFVHFAAEDAVLMRNNKLFAGKAVIDSMLAGQQSTELSWTPDFVDVSGAGDLGYTYGKYSFSFKDENGNTVENNGIFHTVWKRQEDGSWKYVWD